MSLFGRVGKGTPFDWLVVGLGNPGQKYARSRHNVGEEAVTLLAERRGTALKGGRDNALVAETRFADDRVVLAFPITFMNDSGQAVERARPPLPHRVARADHRRAGRTRSALPATSRSRPAAGSPATTGCARSSSI